MPQPRTPIGPFIPLRRRALAPQHTLVRTLILRNIPYCRQFTSHVFSLIASLMKAPLSSDRRAVIYSMVASPERSERPWSRTTCRPLCAPRRPIPAILRTISSFEPSRPHGLSERLRRTSAHLRLRRRNGRHRHRYQAERIVARTSDRAEKPIPSHAPPAAQLRPREVVAPGGNSHLRSLLERLRDDLRLHRFRPDPFSPSKRKKWRKRRIGHKLALRLRDHKCAVLWFLPILKSGSRTRRSGTLG